MKRKFRYVFVNCLLIVSGLQIANACVCIGYRAPCEEYAVADVVVLAKIESISFTRSDGGWYNLGQTVRMSVERSYKGTNEKTITLSQPDTSCDRQFAESDKGKTFLLYLDRNKGTNEYTILTCGRSGESERAADDLSWLNALPDSLKRTRFSGELSHYTKAPEFTFPDYLAGTKVRIFNASKSYEVMTDKNGLYEVWDLPPEGYKVEPSFLKGYRPYFEMRSGLLDAEKWGGRKRPFRFDHQTQRLRRGRLYFDRRP